MGRGGVETTDQTWSASYLHCLINISALNSNIPVKENSVRFICTVSIVEVQMAATASV